MGYAGLIHYSITHLDGCLEVLWHLPEVHIIAAYTQQLLNATKGTATLLGASITKCQHGGNEDDDAPGTWAAQLHAVRGRERGKKAAELQLVREKKAVGMRDVE